MGAGIIGFEVDLRIDAELLRDHHRRRRLRLRRQQRHDADGQPDHRRADRRNVGPGVRPYASGGIGLLRTNVSGGDLFDDLSTNELGVNVGAGAHVFFSDNVGMRGDIRYFRSLQDDDDDDDCSTCGLRRLRLLARHRRRDVPVRRLSSDLTSCDAMSAPFCGHTRGPVEHDTHRMRPLDRELTKRRARLTPRLPSPGIKKNRARTARLFDLLTDEAYYAQPIALRHPIVFYEGHLPGLQPEHAGEEGARAAGRRRRARAAVRARHRSRRSRRRSDGRRSRGPIAHEVRAFVEAADALVIDALAHADLDVPGHPLLDGAAGGLHDPRARGDAPGDAALHVASAAVRRRSARPRTTAVDHRRLPVRRTRDRRSRRARVRLGAAPGEIPFGWDNEFGPLDVDVDGVSRSIAATSPTPSFCEFVEAGGYSQRDWWTPDDWHWLSRARHPASVVLGARRRRVVLARHVRADAAAARVAGLRQPGRSDAPTRAGADGGCRPRPSISARPTDRRATSRASIPGATTRRRRARRVRLRELGAAAGRHASRGRSPRGASTISSATAGSGPSTIFAPFPGFVAEPVLSGILRRLLRRIALRDEGRVAGDGARAAAADVPQLVPPALSVRLRDVPLRAGGRVTRAGRAPSSATRRGGVARRRRPLLPDADAAAAAVARALRRARVGALRRDLPAAVVSGHARRAPPDRRASRRDPRAPRASPIGSSSSAAATARSSICCSARRHAAARRSRRIDLVDVSASALAAAAALGRRRSRPSSSSRTQARYEDGLARVARHARRGERCCVLFLGSNIGNFDPPGAAAFLATIRAGAGARRRAADRRRPGEARARPAARLRRSARRHRRVQPEPARADQSRAGRDFDLDGFDHRAVWNAADSRVEMHLVSRAPPARRHPGRRLVARLRRRARRSGRRAPTSTTATAFDAMLSVAAFSTSRRWIDGEGRFLLTVARAET